MSNKKGFEYNGKTYKRRTVVYNQLLNLGLPIQTIADRLGVTYAAVYLFKQAQEKQGKTYPKVPNQRVKSKIRIGQMADLAKEGRSRRQIAKKLGVSYELVSGRLKAAGVEVKDMRAKGNRKPRKSTAKALAA